MQYLDDFHKISNFKFIIILSVFILDILTFIIINIFKNSKCEKNQNKNVQMEFSNIEEFDQEILFPIQKKLEGFIELTNDEQRFLNGLIRKIRPKKIVEIGVAYGGSSVVILNAIKDINDSKLFSIDINKKYYRLPSKDIGFIVQERFSELIFKWEKNFGGFTSEFIEKIGNEIDLVYIDTVHFSPGEMINFLEILPFLKEEAFVVLHDTFLMYINNTITKEIKNYSNNLRNYQK